MILQWLGNCCNGQATVLSYKKLTLLPMLQVVKNYVLRLNECAYKTGELHQSHACRTPVCTYLGYGVLHGSGDGGVCVTGCGPHRLSQRHQPGRVDVVAQLEINVEIKLWQPSWGQNRKSIFRIKLDTKYKCNSIGEQMPQHSQNSRIKFKDKYTKRIKYEISRKVLNDADVW